jgi:hypothetical protein
MAKGDLIGHMDCPCCGMEAEVNEDKNGKPLMFCRKGCKAQMFTRKPEQVEGLMSRIRRAIVEAVPKADEQKPEPAKGGFWESLTGVA